VKPSSISTFYTNLHRDLVNTRKTTKIIGRYRRSSSWHFNQRPYKISSRITNRCVSFGIRCLLCCLTMLIYYIVQKMMS